MDPMDEFFVLFDIHSRDGEVDITFYLARRGPYNQDIDDVLKTYVFSLKSTWTTPVR
jgi:hypothetical protein